MTEQTQKQLDQLVSKVKGVRRRLILQAILKIAAICLFFVIVYIGGYAWLDHKFNFSVAGRIVALVGFIGGLLGLGFYLIRHLASHISCSRAANYIESKMNFDQQLVTAIEYHENSKDYPYSKNLAEQLVVKTHKSSEYVDFKTTVSKWLSSAFAMVIVAGILLSGLFLHDNFTFFSSYFTRLVDPTNVQAEALPATELDSITEDILARTDTAVTMSVGIKGSIPETGQLIIAKGTSDPNDPSSDDPLEMIPVKTVRNKQNEPELKVKLPFMDKGDYRYWFEAGQAKSQVHDLKVQTVPEILNIDAKVLANENLNMNAFTQTLKSSTLKVFENSGVILSVVATEELESAEVTGPDGSKSYPEIIKSEKPAVTDPNNPEEPKKNTFKYAFDAVKPGFYEFKLTSKSGVTNDKIPPLQVVIRPDKPAKIKLVSPSGDYLATNVGSIPIEFAATDDFGLDKISLILEIAGGEPESTEVEFDKWTKKGKITRMLEIEDLDLSIGDSIIYYAEAVDMNTSGALERLPSMSDIYFIEIKPYLKRWHQMQAPAFDENNEQTKQGLEASQEDKHDKLIEILEYTRAFVKKTWAIANRKELSDKDKSRIESIRKDVAYTSEQLTMIIDDPMYMFNEEEKETLKNVLDYYSISMDLLDAKRAKDALVPEKKAYTTLRKFIVQLEMTIMQGPPPPPKPKPEQLKIDDQLNLTMFNKEKQDWEMERLADNIAEIAVEQEEIKKMFDKFMENKSKQEENKQKVTDEMKNGSNGNKPTKDPGDKEGPEGKQSPKGAGGGVSVENMQNEEDGKEGCEKCDGSGSSECECGSGSEGSGGEGQSGENGSGGQGQNGSDGQGGQGQNGSNGQGGQGGQQSGGQQSGGQQSGGQQSGGQQSGGQQSGQQSGQQNGNQQGGQNGDQKGGQNGDQKGGQNGDQQGGQNGDQKGGQNGDQKGGQNGDQKGGQNGDQKGGQNGDQKGGQNGDQKSGQNGDQKGGQNGDQKGGQNGEQKGGQNGGQEESGGSGGENCELGSNGIDNGKPARGNGGKGAQTQGNKNQKQSAEGNPQAGGGGGTGGTASGTSSNGGSKASSQQQMDMIQARQKELRQRVERLKETLKTMEEIAEGSMEGGQNGTKETRDSLTEATNHMNEFNNKVNESLFNPDPEGAKEKLGDAGGHLPEAANELRDAESSIRENLPNTDNELIAQTAEALARDMDEMAEDLKKGKNGMSEKEVGDHLKKVEEQLIELEKWVPKEQRLPELAKKGKDIKEDPIKKATALARRFKSISINAKKLESPISDDEASDAKYYESEVKYFKKAAEYNK